MRKLIVVAMAAMVAAACDGDGTGVTGAQVSVVFDAPASTAASLGGFGLGSGLARSTTVSGTNGVLSLDTVHVILNEFELEQVERVDDCDASGTGNPCREFEAPPSLMQLPMDGGVATAVTAEIPEGEYDELEFEIEDLEDDEEDPAKAQQIEELRNAILADFNDWPRKASMRVVGTFTPDGGEPVPFRVYVDAEIEVELEFATPFVVTATDVSRTITVALLPSDWFARSDGTVMDLSQYDYPTTSQIPEFEVEIGDGFKSVEHDDD